MQSDKKAIFPLHFIISFTSRYIIDCLFYDLYILYSLQIAFPTPFMLHCIIKLSSQESTLGTVSALYCCHLLMFSTCSAAYTLKGRQLVSVLSLCLAP